MTKHSKIYLTLEDGRKYSILAHVVAHDRATYYAKCDKTTTYQEEYDYTIGSRSELRDWLENNMDWFEHDPVFEESAIFIDPKDVAVEEYEVD